MILPTFLIVLIALGNFVDFFSGITSNKIVLAGLRLLWKFDALSEGFCLSMTLGLCMSAWN